MFGSFGSFGCCDGFKECRHGRNDHCQHGRNDHRQHGRNDHRQHDKNDGNHQNRVSCNVLANVSIGTRISLLCIKGCGTFRDVVFEGFSGGVALFSNECKKHHYYEECEEGCHHNDHFKGVLRVCPDDITALSIC
ncbi:DUF3915 family protein [Bacillus sp. C1]